MIKTRFATDENGKHYKLYIEIIHHHAVTDAHDPLKIGKHAYDEIRTITVEGEPTYRGSTTDDPMKIELRGHNQLKGQGIIVTLTEPL